MPFIEAQGFVKEHNPQKLGPIYNSVEISEPKIHPDLPALKNVKKREKITRPQDTNEKIVYNETYGANMKNFYIPGR